MGIKRIPWLAGPRTTAGAYPEAMRGEGYRFVVKKRIAELSDEGKLLADHQTPNTKHRHNVIM